MVSDSFAESEDNNQEPQEPDPKPHPPPKSEESNYPDKDDEYVIPDTDPSTDDGDKGVKKIEPWIEGDGKKVSPLPTNDEDPNEAYKKKPPSIHELEGTTKQELTLVGPDGDKTDLEKEARVQGTLIIIPNPVAISSDGKTLYPCVITYVLQSINGPAVLQFVFYVTITPGEDINVEKICKGKTVDDSQLLLVKFMKDENDIEWKVYPLVDEKKLITPKPN